MHLLKCKQTYTAKEYTLLAPLNWLILKYEGQSCMPKIIRNDNEKNTAI